MPLPISTTGMVACRRLLLVLAASMLTLAVFTTPSAAAPEQVSTLQLAGAIQAESADLAVTKVVDNPTPDVGDTITFTLTLINNGPDDATGVEVTDQLSATLTFVSATPSQGTYDPATGLWTVGSMAPTAVTTLQIQATVTTADAFTNQAQITASDQADPDPTNNFDAVTVPATASDLAVTKAVDDATPNVGDTITFTLTLTNNGPGDATTVSVHDLLPDGLTFVAATPSQGTYDPATGLWTVGTVASGATATLQVQAGVTTAGPKTNTAAISTVDQADPDPTNNSASAAVSPVPPASPSPSPGPGGGLPVTGTSGWTTTAGAALVLAGIALLVVLRRRRHAG